MDRYYDEKQPLNSEYEVVEVDDLVERVQAKKCKRPFWRRALRIIMTVVVASMIWSTFAPVFRYSGGCGHHKTPAHIATPPNLDFDYLATMPTSGEDPEDKPKTPLLHYTFPSKITSFTVEQATNSHFGRTQVVGNLIVHSCPKAKNISTHFHFSATDDSLLEDIEITPTQDSITFKLNPFSFARQTVNATVYVVIPKGDEYKLQHLRVGVTELDIWIKDTVTTPINMTSISTVSGHITSYGTAEDKNALDIEHLRLLTVSGDIKGEFPLHHALDIESTSGNIHANVTSKDLPEEKAWFKTGNVGGNTKVKFVSNLNPRPLYSKHESVSGGLRVWYPEDWQGGLKIKTVSGKIDVSGEGTKIVKKEKDIVGKFWKVIKGDGKSRAWFGSVSGDIKILVGEAEDDE